jgi:hypothetical protein
MEDDSYDAYNIDAVHKLLNMSAPPPRQAELPVSYDVVSFEVQADPVMDQGSEAEEAPPDPAVGDTATAGGGEREGPRARLLVKYVSRASLFANALPRQTIF